MSFTATDFATLCAQGPVATQITTIEDTRRKAVSRFWTLLLGGLAAVAVIAFVLANLLSVPVGATVFFAGAIFLFIFAFKPLAAAGESIKLPTLEALAAQGGMSFTPTGFEPPVFAEARRALFGSWLSSANFSDLFYGTGADGKRFAFYEGELWQGHGKHRAQVFSGQFYGFERHRTQVGDIVAVPDRGLFNFFKPAGGFQRVRIETDPEFEKKFELYAIDQAAARMMFGGSEVRRLLLDLRQQGKVFLFVGPNDVLAAVHGRNRYEPGSMFSSKAGEARVRLMFDDVCAAMEIVKRLKSAFG
jgi:hypothetical protein